MTWSIVVTDGEQRASLAVVRALGRAGHSVHVCAAAPRSLSAASRFAAGASVVPEPLDDPDGFVAALRAVTASCRADVLLPISEAALLAVLPQRAGFRPIIPFAAAHRFEAICDKHAVLRAAAAIGIDVPAQRLLASRHDAEVLRELRYPVVLKPSRSVVGSKGKRVKTRVLYASDAQQLARALALLPDASFPILCQQRVEGPGTAISVLVWDREVKAAFAHRRLREKPPSGGVSVLRESMALDGELLAKSVALLREFDWQGVAMVEFKVDAKSGRPYLMEINGRFWGSLQLAIDAGLDFPQLLVHCAMGRAVAPVLDYPSGVRTRWEWGEVDHLLARLLHSSSTLALPEGSPSRLQSIRALLTSLASDTRSEVFSRDDMRPFLRETVNWLRRR